MSQSRHLPPEVLLREMALFGRRDEDIAGERSDRDAISSERVPLSSGLRSASSQREPGWAND
jgi:hypothetical protein